ASRRSCRRARRRPRRRRGERLQRGDHGHGARLSRARHHAARVGPRSSRPPRSRPNVMGLAGAAVVGFLTGRLTWVLLRPAVTTPLTVRQNWRGREVVTGAGIVLPLAALLVEAGRAVAGAAGAGEAVGLTGARALVLLAAVGF